MGSSSVQVERVCRERLTAKVLREQVLAALRIQVPFDGHVFALTDPVTMVATAPHADVPMLPWDRLPDTIRWRYLTTLNRVDRMVGRPAASLLGTGAPTDSLVWVHVLREVGVLDTAIVAFSDRYGTWAYLELWRTTEPFSQADLDVLSSLVVPVTAGLRSALARTFTGPVDPSVPSGPAVVLLGDDLAVHQLTDGAAAALFTLLPPDEARAPIPAAAYNLAGALLAAEAGVPVGEPWSRVHLGGRHWVTIKASRLGAQIAVSIEPSTTAERLDLLARACGLSDRESQVISLLGVGLDTREIAGQLFLSEHTVNDHVKAVLTKTGTRTRQVLLARVAGAV